MAKARARTPHIGIPEFGFSGTWRGYQQRLLDELDRHLDDRKLHVVAAPGAGKTIVGLEVVRRLKRPTLILSPTLAIREQWIERLTTMFDGVDDGWRVGVGSTLAAPGWLTSSTYQSVHAAVSGGVADDDIDDVDDEETDAIGAESKVDDLLGALTRAGVATLVLDEAHHLRRAWWESLQRVIAHLGRVQPSFHIVSLTATPPYDVEEGEWDRYMQTCGPIDAEVSIPELVRQGDLCPHQDYVHFSFPRAAEIGAFETFAREADQLVTRWCANPGLVAMVREHPWHRTPTTETEAILERPELHAALLTVAATNGMPSHEAAYSQIGARPGTAPRPTARWLAPLFQAILDDDAGVDVAPEIGAALLADLRAIGGVRRGKVRLHKDEHLARALTGSAGKIESAIDIARVEIESLGASLRLVILADYVRAEALRRPEDRSTDRLGAGTIFRRLVSEGLAEGLDAALVTGSTVVVPAAVEASLIAEARQAGLGADAIALRPLPKLADWLLVDMAASQRALRLTIITRLFERGVLRCLVGTAALLGEGWDAPSINSLILATSVKAFMLSNQMRGRAIRRHPAVPDKTATIWHLATVIPPDLVLAQTERSIWERLMKPVAQPEARGVLELTPRTLGRDARMLALRFKTFAGVTHEAPSRIRSNVSRLGVLHHKWIATTVVEVNLAMQARAVDRRAITTAWRDAVGGALRMERPVVGVETEPPMDGLSYIWMQGVAALLAPLAAWLFYAVVLYGDAAEQLGADNALIVGAAIVVGGLAWNWRRIWRLVSAGSPGRYLREIGSCILDGLHAADQLHVPRAQLSADILNFGSAGTRYCAAGGGTQHDESLFADAMAEFLEPIRNPKHILVRATRIWLLRQTDYHAVPALISADKMALAAFERGWRRRIGRVEIHSARSRIGRQLLLRARARQYAGAFVACVDKLTIWE